MTLIDAVERLLRQIVIVGNKPEFRSKDALFDLIKLEQVLQEAKENERKHPVDFRR